MNVGDIAEWKPAVGKPKQGRVIRIENDTGRVYLATPHRGLSEKGARGEVYFDKDELHRLTVVIALPTKLRFQVLNVLRHVARKQCVVDNCGTVCKCEPCDARAALETLDPGWIP